MKIFTYRYMWQLEGSDKINIKIVSDVPEGISVFEKQLLSLSGLLRAGKEYLHEYDCASIGKFESLYGGEDNEA